MSICITQYFLSILVPDGTEFGDSASVPAGEIAGETAVDKNKYWKLAERYSLEKGACLSL